MVIFLHFLRFFFQPFGKIDFCSKTSKNMFFELLRAFWAKKKISNFREIFFLGPPTWSNFDFFSYFFLVFFLFFFNLWFSILKFFSKIFKISEIANLGSKHVFSERIGPKKCQEQKLEHFRSGRKKRKNIRKISENNVFFGSANNEDYPLEMNNAKRKGFGRGEHKFCVCMRY